MNQAEFSRRFNETHREEFNPDLFKRDNQELVDSIRLVVESIQRDKYFTLKLLSFETIWDYEAIYDTLRRHTEGRRRKNDKNENSFNYIDIKDSDIILCRVRWFIQHNGSERVEVEGKTYEVKDPNQEIEVLIALPRFVKGYYFRLNGNYYSTSFQIVDGSTYNNNNATNAKAETVTLKTMMTPMRVFRALREFKEYHSNSSMKVIEYVANVFSNTVNALFYLFAQFGLYGATNFLEINCVALSSEPNPYSDTYFCFEKNGIYVSVPKEYFKDAMVQTLVASLLDGIYKDTKLTDLFDQRYWLKVLGMAYKNASIDKGLFVLDSIDGIYDKITKRDLHLNEEDKENIYTIFRWLLREFSALKMKENIDVRTKRIRLPDYISAVYATKLNQGMYRVSDMGKRVTLNKVIQAVYTTPFYILNNLSNANMSNLVSYRDLVNDGDAISALKFTYKGISGLGEGGGSIQKIYRQIDPSHLGILDLDSSSNSDPGMTGMICPMAKLYNDHSFSEYEEPNTWREQYKPLYEKKDPNLISPIRFTIPPNPFPYETFRGIIENEELDISKLSCPIHGINGNATDYSSAGAILVINMNKDFDNKSLFTVISEDSEEDNTIYLNEDDDFEE